MKLPVQNLKLDNNNPSPFVQPFLELVLAGDGAKKLMREGMMHIDVNGQIDKYITRDNKATPLLVELCQAIAKSGAVVTQFSRYEGSAGPSVILRNGALFSRMDSIEHPADEVFAYEYREPKYRGP